MQYRQLGHSDIKVSALGLGSMTWGSQNSREEAFAQMDYALEHGINFIDTAEIYPVPPSADTCGRSESIIGDWLNDRHSRSKIVIATKMAGPAPNLYWVRQGKGLFDRISIQKALEGSLKRLKTDVIDLYQLHWPDRSVNIFGNQDYVHSQHPAESPIFQILEVLNDFIKSGKIRHYGLSNETPWGVMTFIQTARNNNFPLPVSIQNPYNLLNRLYEIGMSEISHREKIGLIAYSPMGFGTLSGKYLKGQKPQGSRLDVFGGHFRRYSSDRATSATNKYVRLAEYYGIRASQMALSFAASRPFVASALVGATNADQLAENLRSLDLPIPSKIMEKINEIHSQNPNPAP